MNPKHPVYIPTKGRADSRMTIKMFQRLGVPFTIFIEKQDFAAYAPHVKPDQIHIMPHQNKGVTVTRNYMWDFAEAQGHEWYWSFDDNINGLYRFHENIKTPCADGTIMAVIEDFTDRYENIAVSGMNYFMFATRKSDKIPPYTLNTRVYSNMLIRTNAKDRDGNKFRFATFFNEDTELCLTMLKSSWTTVLFNAFLIMKTTTMTMNGGNREYYDKTDKRKEFVEELIRRHPDCVELTEKWGRWHHQVDYSRFKQPLRRKPDVQIPDVTNNFGMILEERFNGVWEPRKEEPHELLDSSISQA